MYIKSKFSHQKKFQSYAPKAWVVNRDRAEYDTDYIKYKNLIFQAREYYEKNNNYDNKIVIKNVKKQPKNKPSIKFKKYKNKNVLVVKKAGV